MKRRSLSFLATAAVAGALLIAPAYAPAARVSATESGSVHLLARSGEANRVTLRVTRVDPDYALEIVDTGAPLIAGPGCSSVAADTAICPFPFSAEEFRARLGDRPDSIDIFTFLFFSTFRVFGGTGADDIRNAHGGPAEVHGQRGNDVLFVSNNNSPGQISGGPGDDDLSASGFGSSGRPGRMDGGRGDDTLRLLAQFTVGDGGAGADDLILDSGEATYEDRTRPVSVSLDGIPNDGERGEGDNVFVAPREPDDFPAFPSVRGGHGPDRLSGSQHSDSLFGGPGDDFLDGMGAGDWLDCGAGTDVFVSDPADFTVVDCEVVG